MPWRSPRQRWVTVVLSGAATTTQLATNLAAARCAVTADQVDGLTGVAESPEHYWRKRAALAWT